MSAGETAGPVQVGDWVVDPALDEIARDGISQKVEPRTMRLLLCLIDAAGAVVSIDQLLSEVWSGVIVGPASVYQSVSQLRRILGDTDSEPSYIATVPRKGYRLIAPVRPLGQIVMPAAGDEAPPAYSPPIAGALVPSPKRRSHRYVPAGLGIVVLIAVVAVAWTPVKKLMVPAASAMSIAVLPFVDMTADKSDQPFCDGLTEELANWLAQIPTLRVVARTSAFAFRGQDQDVRKIGKALDTDHILEGSMRRFGDHMRVTVQLIDASSGFHLWSATYDRAMADTIKLQDDISRSVAESLQIRLTRSTSERFAARQSSNPQAYEQYLLARHYQQERTDQANDHAIHLYRQILAEDPKFTLAFVGLSYALLNQNWLHARPINDIAAEIEPLLQAALVLDAQLADVYAVRGALRAEQLRNDEALADFLRAVRINPSDSLAYAEMGRLFLINRGQPRDALDDYSKAAVLDPLNYLPQAQRCVALQDLGRYPDAAAACERARELQPQGYWPLTATSWLMSAQGRLDEALQWNEKALKAAPDFFPLYKQRATLLLTLGLPLRARETLNIARVQTQEGESVDEALAQVAFYEGGAAALRAHLAATRMEESPHAPKLLWVAYLRLLTGDAKAAKALTDRASKAADFNRASVDSLWEMARWGQSDNLTIVMVDLQTGDRPAAMRRLDTVSAELDSLGRAGERRYAIDELRATVLALRGDADGAVKALTRAADLGWRRSWWAAREPDVSALWGRDDFRALIARVDQTNAEEALKIAR